MRAKEFAHFTRVDYKKHHALRERGSGCARAAFTRKEEEEEEHETRNNDRRGE